MIKEIFVAIIHCFFLFLRFDRILCSPFRADVYHVGNSSYNNFKHRKRPGHGRNMNGRIMVKLLFSLYIRLYLYTFIYIRFYFFLLGHDEWWITRIVSSCFVLLSVHFFIFSLSLKETDSGKASSKKLFLNISQNSQENTCG